MRYFFQDRRTRHSIREQAERERLAAEARARDEAERLAPARAEARVGTEDRRKRDEIRARAVLTFSLYATKLEGRFDRADFEAYLERYMGDDQLPEDVERRYEELVRTLQQHAEVVEPPEQKRSLDDLARWYSEQQERIETLPLDEKSKRAHLAELNVRYAELSQQLLMELEP